MKKLAGLFLGSALLALSTQASADAALGEKIYKRAFGRGCGTCHDIKSNPQLPELIKAGKLPKDQFASVLKNGKNGMPKATDDILKIAKDKSEAEAIDSLYEFLSQ